MNTNLDPQDLALRVLLVVAGMIAAVLFALKGQAQVLPALALGATLGTFFMGSVDSRQE